MNFTKTQADQCLWCGTQGVEILHRQYVLPLCPKCLMEFKSDE